MADFSTIPQGLRVLLHLSSGSTTVVARGTDTAEDTAAGLMRFQDTGMGKTQFLVNPDHIIAVEFTP